VRITKGHAFAFRARASLVIHPMASEHAMVRSTRRRPADRFSKAMRSHSV
jgi:hypothetical protein